MATSELPDRAEFVGWPPCDVCGGALPTATGAVDLDRGSFEVGRRLAVDEVPFVRAGSAARVNWRWAHNNCVQDRGEIYYINLARLDTYDKVRAETEDMVKYTWFAYTDWYEQIARAWRP